MAAGNYAIEPYSHFHRTSCVDFDGWSLYFDHVDLKGFYSGNPYISRKQACTSESMVWVGAWSESEEQQIVRIIGVTDTIAQNILEFCGFIPRSVSLGQFPALRNKMAVSLQRHKIEMPPQEKVASVMTAVIPSSKTGFPTHDWLAGTALDSIASTAADQEDQIRIRTSFGDCNSYIILFTQVLSVNNQIVVTEESSEGGLLQIKREPSQTLSAIKPSNREPYIWLTNHSDHCVVKIAGGRVEEMWILQLITEVGKVDLSNAKVKVKDHENFVKFMKRRHEALIK